MTATAQKLTIAPAPAHVDSDALERSVLEYWQREKIFEQSLEQKKSGKLFSFYDGPPYATGKPHYGHILQSAIKDTVLRYKTMQGYYVPRRVGWDCHGLPVETLVEKELGIKNKQEIETLGIEKFNAACRAVVFRYIHEFTATLQRVGRWADYENAYATLNREYMETEWWAFKHLWEQGLVYKAYRSTPYCIRCATPLSNFEVSTNYRDTVDTAVYVRLKVRSHGAGKQPELLIWTTTPWTLPANVAVAISSKLTYVSVVFEGQHFIVAADRVKAIFGDGAPVVKTWTLSELTALTYEPLYTFTPTELTEGPVPYRIVVSDHVGAGEGTGVVHLAPAYGEEDAALAKTESLPILALVDRQGRFVDEVTTWAGQNIFAATKSIVADLQQRGRLFKEEAYKHSYPFCWRCETPLIYYALDTWFIKVADLKERMLALNEEISWTPAHVKKGRFAKGILSAPDWAVSRNRYWSVPMPIWECSLCHHRKVVGSIGELEELAGVASIPDIHRPAVDSYTWACSECQGIMQRVPEVLDVWFDAGCMPYAQSHYPFEHAADVEASFPADFIIESIEQTRLWFYVLHVLATAVTATDIGLGKDRPAFTHAIGSGLIFAADGQKLSKKLKNYPDLDPTIQKYGADVLRLYLLTSATLGEPYRFSENDLQKLQRTTYLTWWNVYSFFTRYAETHHWQPNAAAEPSSHVLDRWVLARLRALEHEVMAATDTYQIDQAARAFIPFIDDVSNWYVRRSRSRFHPASGKASRDTEAAFSTLYEVLVRTLKLLAPFMPFVTEAMYRNLTGQPSVHLERLPSPDDAALRKGENDVLQAMARARQLITAGQAARAAAKVKVRQPLATLFVPADILSGLSEELAAIVRDELNVGALAAGEAVDFDFTITPDLRRAGLAREIIRQGQTLRRDAAYALDDAIVLYYVTDSPELAAALAVQEKMIATTLQATITRETGAEDAGIDLTLPEGTLHLGVRKKNK